MEKLFGLPAHPLIVHAPVVLLPIAAIFAAIVAIHSGFRMRFGRAVLLLTAVATVSTFVARQSGEGMFQLMNESPPIAKHQDLANTTMLMALGFLVLLGLLIWVAERAVRTGGKPASWAMPTLTGLTILMAVLSTIWMVRTGHEGAKVNWETISGTGG